MKSKGVSLIIIQGAPGTGKSTLAHKLQKDLGIGLLSADDIKEFLFDQIGIGTREWSNDVGRSLKPYLYELAKISLQHQKSIIFESAFWTELAKSEMAKLLEETQANTIELYCFATEDVRLQRFNDRSSDGTRHKGHAGEALGDKETYQKIAVSDTIEIDTTNFDDKDYQALKLRLSAFLQEVDS